MKIDTKAGGHREHGSSVEKVTKAEDGRTPRRGRQRRNGVTGQGNSPLALTQKRRGPNRLPRRARRNRKIRRGHTVVTTTKPGLLPTKVTAAIQIPASHFRQHLKNRNPSFRSAAKVPDAAQIDRIKQSEVKNRGSSPQLASPRSTRTTSIRPSQSWLTRTFPPLRLPLRLSRTRRWEYSGESWRTIGMIAVGLVSL